jgi:hypothetical protein
MSMKFSASTIARFFLYVREAAGPQNTGSRVEAIQRWSGGSKGDSYCCEFATMILDICFQGEAPVPRLQACQDVYELAKKNGWVRGVSDDINIDDLFLYVNSNDHAHHIGIVTGIKKTAGKITSVTGIAGNTSADGTSSNGTGVFEHDIFATVFVAYPR